MYNIIFALDLNCAQAVIAALLFRRAETRRKTRSGDAPDFLAYVSRFIAMLMGRYLLEEMGLSRGSLNHRNFDAARSLVEQNLEKYIYQAQIKIEEVLALLLANQERTLQRLSATFRREDLVLLLK